MFTVNKQDFLKILEDYDDIREEFEKIIDLRIERINKAKEKAIKDNLQVNKEV